MDKLDALLALQKKFQEELGYNFETMTKKEKSAYIIEYSMHINHEVHELLSEIPYFKSWKKYHEGNDYVSAKKEFVDVLHFFLNVALALGFTGEELFEGYMEKHTVNGHRQTLQEYKKCVERECDFFGPICGNCKYLFVAAQVNNSNYMGCNKKHSPKNKLSTCNDWEAADEATNSRETQS